MVMSRINPPPAPSTPRDAPWTDIGALINQLEDANGSLKKIIEAIQSIPGAEGGAGGEGGSSDVRLAASPTQLRSTVEDVGLSAGGTETTLNDPTKYWATNTWAGGIVFMVINNQLYISPITANTDLQLTFAALPTGIRPIAGTPYAIKMIGITAGQLIALLTPLITKVPTAILTLATLAATLTSTLAQCTAIDLLVGPSALALTVECTFNPAAVQGIRVHVRTSYDNVNYDTQDWDTWTPTFVAGAAIRATKVYDVSPAYVKVLIQNLDAAQPVTLLNVESTVRG